MNDVMCFDNTKKALCFIHKVPFPMSDEGFEPPTPSLSRMYSPTELIARLFTNPLAGKLSEESSSFLYMDIIKFTIIFMICQ